MYICIYVSGIYYTQSDVYGEPQGVAIFIGQAVTAAQLKIVAFHSIVNSVYF